MPPQPVRREAPDPPVTTSVRATRPRWWLPLIAAVVLVVVLVGALSLAGLGPLAPGPDVPGAAFDADRYADDPAALTLSDVATRTTAPDADAEAAAAMVDGDPATAWRSEGAAPDDGEVLDTIDLVLDAPGWVERLEVRNGDHLDRDAYDASARLREVRLRFDGGVVVLADLLDIGLQVQRIDLPEPVLTSVVRIDVLRAVEGASDQLAVSAIELLGWSAEADDVDLAEERARAEPATGPVTPVSLG